MSDDAPPTDGGHSRAFENLVRDSDDIVGLLAYAKYKQSVHEAAQSGNVPDRAARNVQPAMVEMLRSAAEQMITEVAADAVAAAEPEIERSAIARSMEAQHEKTLAAIKSERAALETHVTNRTSFVPAFLINLGAWAVTLIVAVLILNLAGRPDPEEVLSKAVGGVAPKQQGALKK